MSMHIGPTENGQYIVTTDVWKTVSFVPLEGMWNLYESDDDAWLHYCPGVVIRKFVKRTEQTYYPADGKRSPIREAELDRYADDPEFFQQRAEFAVLHGECAEVVPADHDRENGYVGTYPRAEAEEQLAAILARQQKLVDA